MIERIVRLSLENRGLVLIGTLLLLAAGLYSASELPLDAVPDVTNVQVQVNTEVPGMGPVEVEKLVTAPIETALSALLIARISQTLLSATGGIRYLFPVRNA